MIRKVDVNDIRPNPFQPRKSQDHDAIKSLAEEIEKVGLWSGALRGRECDGHIQLCFGHRRLDAVKHLGWKDVDVDVVKLSDEDMASQALIENLQREGLNDADRGDGIVAYIKLKAGVDDISPMHAHGGARRGESKASADLLMAAKREACSLLGLNEGRVNELLKIAGWDEKLKEPIRQQKIAGKTAAAAYRIGGAEAIDSAAKNEIGSRAMQDIGTEFAALPEATERDKKVKEKVRESFTKGKIRTGEEVKKTARRAKAQTFLKSDAPPDLIDVMRGWTERSRRWAEQLEQVAPYIDYIDGEPQVAERWREAVKVLIEKLEKFV